MKTIFFTSDQPGSGVTTIVINLATGLVRSDKRVLIGSLQPGKTLTEWLHGSAEVPVGLSTRYTDLQYIEKSNFTPAFKGGTELFPDGRPADYFLLIGGGESDLFKVYAKEIPLVLWVLAVGQEDLEPTEAFDRTLRQAYGKDNGIDLIVPNKAQPGEWKKTSEWVFRLAEKLGWEKVADPIPYCEAIHDLAKTQQSVWELPDYYNNRKEAFQNLVEKVEKGLECNGDGSHCIR